MDVFISGNALFVKVGLLSWDYIHELALKCSCTCELCRDEKHYLIEGCLRFCLGC